MDAVIAFFYARAGRARGFRFKDWKDYQATDQALYDRGDGTYQLAKHYISGGIDYVRLIREALTRTGEGDKSPSRSP